MFLLQIRPRFRGNKKTCKFIRGPIEKTLKLYTNVNKQTKLHLTTQRAIMVGTNDICDKAVSLACSMNANNKKSNNKEESSSNGNSSFSIIRNYRNRRAMMMTRKKRTSSLSSTSTSATSGRSSNSTSNSFRGSVCNHWGCGSGECYVTQQDKSDDGIKTILCDNKRTELRRGSKSDTSNKSLFEDNGKETQTSLGCPLVESRSSSSSSSSSSSKPCVSIPEDKPMMDKTVAVATCSSTTGDQESSEGNAIDSSNRVGNVGMSTIPLKEETQQPQHIMPTKPDASRDMDDSESSSMSGCTELMSLTSCSTSTTATTTTAILSKPTKMIDGVGNCGTYAGSIRRRTGRPHGKGVMTYKDVIYDGSWVDGDWSGGHGTLKDRHSNDVYHGGFFDNHKHGHGVMTYDDGRTYEGVFHFGLLRTNQTVRLTYGDGNKYWGYVSSSPEGKPHGRGKFTYTDGRIFDGEFDNGIIQGHGRMTYPDGRWYLGEWSDGKPNGLGLQVTQNGKVEFEGIYCNGKPIQSSSFPHRKLSSGRFLLYRSSTRGGARHNYDDGTHNRCHRGATSLVGPLRQAADRIYMKKPSYMKFAL